MSMRYEKTQVGWLLIILLAIMIGFVIFSFLFVERPNTYDYSGIGAIGIFLILVTLCFYKLTIVVADHTIKLIYGIGLIRINIKPQKVMNVQAVKTSVFAGYGIRFTLNGMLYNIQGNKAVQIKYNNGTETIVRIGTDEPDKLSAAIRNEFSL